MSKVYSIVRVSSVGQSDNTSLEHQKDTITKYCDLYDMELQEIVEEVYTGTTEDRDGLNYVKEKVLSGDKLTMNNMRDANLYDIWKEFAVELPDDIDPVLLTKQLYWILTNPYKIEPKFKQGNVIKRSYQAVQHYLGYS